MSTPFLTQFSSVVVGGLLARGRLEIEPGSDEAVTRHLAAFLAGLPSGHSLISSISRGLLASAQVVELYADDDEIKDLVDSLGAG